MFGLGHIYMMVGDQDIRGTLMVFEIQIAEEEGSPYPLVINKNIYNNMLY